MVGNPKEEKVLANILVIEEDKNLALLYKKELAEEGYDVFVARGGREAVAMARRTPPDLVVLGVNIVEMAEVDAVEEIIKEGGRVPVIINASSPSPKLRNKLRTWWFADTCLLKSADLSELKRTIKELLRKGKKE